MKSVLYKKNPKYDQYQCEVILILLPSRSTDMLIFRQSYWQHKYFKCYFCLTTPFENTFIPRGNHVNRLLQIVLDLGIFKMNSAEVL